MKQNIGTTDRIIRLVLGSIIVGVGYYLDSLVALIGLLPIITALLGWCPGYLPFGISTCNEEDNA